MDARFYLQDQVEDISKYLTNFCETLSIEIIIFEQLYSVLWFKNFLSLKQKKSILPLTRKLNYLDILQNIKTLNFLIYIILLHT